MSLCLNMAICMCCCEPMPKGGNALSRNPNVCASCSSMVDGMGDSNPVAELSSAIETPPPVDVRTEKRVAEINQLKAFP